MALEIAAAKFTLAPPLDLLTRLRLSVMMLLQFAVWGSWFVVFFPYLTNNNFTPAQAGALLGNMALGAILSTMIAGYVADRYFSSQNLMGILHLLGAGLLYLMAQFQSPDQYWPLFAASLGYALLYNPTLALANSIAFTHVPDSTRDFPSIRVLGTVGWIAAGVSLGYLFGEEATRGNGPLLLAATLSALLGLYSFTLPKTPPVGKAGDAIPFVKALGLFRDPSFAVFFLVSFGITIVLAFYYTTTGAFLEKAANVPGDKVGSTMAIGQMAELILLPFLPLFLYRLGMKWVLALGMLCWGLRYLLFAFGGPEGAAFAMVIVGVALHGICFDFFFAAGFIHVDNQAPRDIRASGQALFSFLTYGVGMWLGNLTAGYLQGVYTDSSGAVDWRTFWLVPSVGVLVALVVFVLFFRIQPVQAATAEQ